MSQSYENLEEDGDGGQQQKSSQTTPDDISVFLSSCFEFFIIIPNLI